MKDRLWEYLGSLFIKDIYERVYLLHMDYTNRDILFSINSYSIGIKVLKKHDRASNYMDKDYFYFVFSKDMDFNISWNSFIENLEKWVQLKREGD